MEAEQTTAIAVQAHPVMPAAKELYRVATDVAGLCGEIVKKTAKQIQKRKYVCIEGWQAIAAAHGCVLSIEDVHEDEEQNVIAIAAVKRMSDGAVLGKAEGFVGMDENTWKGRARYARRAMAQTRAMSRAARSAFAHVVVLMDAGLSTTPAEEVPDAGFVEEPQDEQPRGEYRATPDITAYQAKLDGAFQARGFDPEAADRCIAAVCKRKGAASLALLPEQQRNSFLIAVQTGKMDSHKNGAARAKEAEHAVV
jgi:hypothetical protein